MPSPVFKKNGKWYYYCEDWATKCGPFRTETEARIELRWYSFINLGESINQCKRDKVTKICSYNRCPFKVDKDPFIRCPLL